MAICPSTSMKRSRLMRWLAATYAANHWATRWNYVVVDDASGRPGKSGNRGR